jgi:hypothetical protein
MMILGPGDSFGRRKAAALRPAGLGRNAAALVNLTRKRLTRNDGQRDRERNSTSRREISARRQGHEHLRD